ncbi:MAG: BCCT family transporter [Paracoccaceae bacterium]
MSDSTDVDGVPRPDGPVNSIDTDYRVGQDNWQRRFGPFDIDIHNPVFVVSAMVIVLFVALTLIFRETASSVFDAIFNFVTTNFDWLFLSAGNIFVLVCLALIVLPVGKVRLGGAQAKPDFGYLPWFAMLFAAGMGIGLMFYGVAEPVTHYEASVAEDAASADSWAPLGGAAGNEAEARALAMGATIFHWGLHPWAIYGIVALGLALFCYNKGLPLTIRSVFYPIFGDKVWGWPGHVIDTLAVFATLFGLATSLGIGAEQASAGIAKIFGSGDPAAGTQTLFGFGFGNEDESANSVAPLVILICAITAAALVSVVAGLDKGVKRLSELNLGLAAALLLFTIVAGAMATGGFLAVIDGFWFNTVAYAEYLIPLSNPFGREDDNFRQGWTAFYWSWWISWSPFVGMFIARVSRGRTVREFLIAVLVVPTLVGVIWMTSFGGTAVSMIQQGATAISEASTELRLFVMLDQLPLATLTGLVGVALVIVFFVTSSDSGSLVIDTITAGGKVDAPTLQRVFWATFEGGIAIVLLVGGGLTALQAAAVSTGLPFTIVLLLACYAVIVGLYQEPRPGKMHIADQPAE